MMRQLIRAISVSIAWAALAMPAWAQYPFPYNANPFAPSLPNPGAQYQRPPVLSPYLNLNNRGNPGINYFNFVQPQLQLQQPWMGFQGPPLPMTPVGADVVFDPGDPTSVMPRSSAHPSTFYSTGGYFNSLGTIGAGRPAGLQAPQLRR
jgi:hypothetical protein